ncbi:MAG: AraC family transcriptional regulator [Sphingobacteriaceae bacterium]|nr:MAG: AraC family transcriptional regulator [Sphingobacteriaceae bacterium]
MQHTKLHRIKSISEYHQFMQLPKPEHPLISIINYDDIKRLPYAEPVSLVFDFYSISLKRNFNAKFRYGQQQYDFDEGIMFFISPGQVFGIEPNKEETLKHSGWMLLLHPDFLWNTPAAKAIRQYAYFDYSVHEALFLSEKEENTIIQLLQNMAQEYHANIDHFSQPVIIAQLELLLTYADRFYHRQFLTRKITNHQILSRLEALLTTYFDSDLLPKKGIPTVSYVADELHISANYLSAMLKVLTGQSTQQHIHNKLIAKAKEKLSASNLSVGEIAYNLGFEHSQSFSKMFKSKTQLSPLAFRQLFN